MMQPEIFRRCATCGASFKSDALFCPQCGAATSRATTEESASEALVDDSIGGKADTDTDTDTAVQPRLSETTPEGTTTPAPGGRELSLPAHVAQAGIAQQRHRAAVSPPRTQRKIRPRVDKLRKGTSIVLEEASYDPSLRFILITGLLFVIFIVLLVLSKWMG